MNQGDQSPAVKTVLLGFGQVAKAVCSLLSGAKVYATTRQPMRLFELMDYALEPVVMPVPSADVITPLATGADVLVSYPPDGKTDAILAAACSAARSIVYISSTGVYGSYRGVVDDTTPAAENEHGTQMRLAAERLWGERGATVLRPPGIYGTHSGLHKRLREKTYEIPGDGSTVLSRIHVDDLAQLVLAAWQKNSGKIYVVGDLSPVPQLEVATWLCSRMGIPIPNHVPVESVSPILRSHRLVDSTRALRELGVTLKYPHYKQGFEACLQANALEEAAVE